MLAAVAALAVLAGAGTVLVAEQTGDRAAPPGSTAAFPLVETAPVPNGGDAADDPAIWLDRGERANSLVIGTDKLGGVAVYDLGGRELQFRPDGDVNNVDLRRGVRLGQGRSSLVVATNRSSQAVAAYRLGRRRRLTPIDLALARPDLSVNGICLYRSHVDRRLYFFVTGLRGEVEQWRIRRRGPSLTAARVRRFELGGSAEACVADDRRRRLYVGEERRGIWSFAAEPGRGAEGRLVDTVGDGRLAADVEGLAIAATGRRSGELIASSQGSNSYAVYDRAGRNRYSYSFEVVASDGIDGVEDTDGLDVSPAGLGPRFPHGLIAVQDGDNDGANQNFKLVPLCARPPLVCGRR